MISQLEGIKGFNTAVPTTLAPPKNTDPPWVSPFTPIKNIKRPVTSPTEKEAMEKLLWYNGKLIASNTLITISGMIVQYDPKNYKLIFEPDYQSGHDTTHHYYGFVNTLKQTRQMKSLFASQMNNMMNGFFMYPEIKSAYDEFDLMSGRYYDLAVNTINLPRTPHAGIQQMIQDLDNYVNNLPGIKQIILPPKRPNNICLCEIPELVDKYEKDLTLWLKNFFKEEFDITTQITGILAEIEYAKNFLKSKSPDFDYLNYLITAFVRANYKVEQLFNEYELTNLESILLEDGLVYAKKNLEYLEDMYDLREISREVKNGVYERSQNLFKEINKAVFSKKFEDYIDDNKTLKNYNVVFDHSLYASHEYNKRILTPGYNVNDNMKKWLESLKDFNRFTLNIKFDFFYQIGGEGSIFMNADGTIESDKIIVSLAIHDCNWEFYIADVDYRNRHTTGGEFRIPMKVTKGTKDYIKDDLGPFSYSGPPEMSMVFPNFNISFCGDKSTALLQSLHYSSADLIKHKNDKIAKVYTVDMQDYANEMFLSVKAALENTDKIIGTAITMMNMGNQQMSQSTGDPAMDYLKADFTMNRKKYDLQYSLNQTSQTAKTVIELGKPASSGRNVVFDNSIELANTNDKDRKIARNLLHGGLTISLVNTPK